MYLCLDLCKENHTLLSNVDDVKIKRNVTLSSLLSDISFRDLLYCICFFIVWSDFETFIIISREIKVCRSFSVQERSFRYTVFVKLQSCLNLL